MLSQSLSLLEVYGLGPVFCALKGHATMTVTTLILVLTIATISATLVAFFLVHRWQRATTDTGTVTLPRGLLIICTMLVAGVAMILATHGQLGPVTHAQNVLASGKQQESTIDKLPAQTDTVISDLVMYAQNTDRSVLPQSPIPDKERSLPGVDVMIERLAARLEGAPDNANDWRMLGWSYFHTNRYREAIDAYSRAIALRPDKASWQSEYGAALVKSSGGKITSKANAAFSQALKLDPSDREARFYVALAKTLNNDKKGALEDWEALLREYPNIQDWSGELRTRILSLANEIGEDVSHRLSVAPRAGNQAEAAKGPDAEDVRAALDLSPEARSEMIRGMVQRLASRLESSPDDAEGWVRLIRSRMVLQEPDKAQAALRRAIDIFSKRPDVKQEVLRKAKAFGVTPGTTALP